MTSLAEFLLARFDDDEAAARESGADAMVGWRWKHYPPEAYEEVQALTLTHSARVLAECKAKRRIVTEAQDYSPELSHGDNGEWALDMTLRALALPHADHPDYCEEWKL